MHVHRGLKELKTIMDSEDLNVTIPITRWRSRWRATDAINADPELQSHLQNADSSGAITCGRNCFFTVLNEELEPLGVCRR